MGLLKAGDHVDRAPRSVFGATVQLFGNILKRFGVETTFVSATDVAAWRAARHAATRKLLFVETPSNPLTEISDIAALAAVAQERGRAAGGGQLLLHAGAAAAAANWAPTS